MAIIHSLPKTNCLVVRAGANTSVTDYYTEDPWSEFLCVRDFVKELIALYRESNETDAWISVSLRHEELFDTEKFFWSFEEGWSID